MAESEQGGCLSCPSLDVIYVHAYAVTDFYTSFIASYVQQAIAAHKKLIKEESYVSPPSLTSVRTRWKWKWKRTGLQRG